MMAKETTLKIPAIHCDSCIRTVRQTVEALPTATVTKADLASKLVRVQFDESALGADRIREALDEVGFSPED